MAWQLQRNSYMVRPLAVVDLARITSWICAWVAGSLHVERSAVDPRRPLFDLGLASVHTIQLAAELAALLARPVSPTLLWEHPTIDALAAHLAGLATHARAAPPSVAPGPGPLAIVGMACRFPRAPDLAAFWRLLVDGVDASGPAPADRWDVGRHVDPDPAAPGKSITDRGAFLPDVRGFEPLFFAISPREADELDPQQRLALELTWEALEDAGVPPRSLVGSATGVFLGSMWHDWADLTRAHVAGMSAHRATGSANNLIANRVSYALGLRGPSLVVDTACSSALVAMHLGGQALALGDADLVIAGAVNLMLSPTSMVFCSKFGGLAADGRCKAFDAAADGFGRGEGGGVVILKRLDRALADGDRIHAVVRATAVNNDGASQGLTAPSPRAQEAVLRTALARAGLVGGDIHYVEAHGTGTLLGDPIEAGALGAVLGADRPDDRPLWLGSVKTNIGHTEGAAGVAGVIKTALAMAHRVVPPSLHLHRPNPHIPFAALHLHVQTAAAPWPAPADEPARAGVSAFGWGGTNAHAILEAPPPDPQFFGLAAADADALAHRLRALADTDDETLANHAGAHGEGPARVAFVARTTHDLRRQLAAATIEDRDLPRPRLVFVCSPLGSQWPGMARRLLTREPAFRAAIGRIDRLFAPLLGRSILGDLAGAWQRDDDVVRAQPLLFAVQVGLAAVLAAWGVVPDAVVGHSAGEIAAAHIAGALTLEQAVQVVHHYARVQRPNAGAGAMAVVALGRDALAPWLAPHAGRVVVAADNSGASTVVSGEAPAIASLIADLQSAGVGVAAIKTDVAGHSPLVADGLRDLADALADLRPSAPIVPLHSSLTGQPHTTPPDGAYWARNLGEPVRFHAAIAGLVATGHDTFIELGPHPVVGHAILQIAPAARVLPTLRRGPDERASLLATRAALFVLGVARPPPPEPAQLLVLSARTAPALESSRLALLGRLATHSPSLTDLCFTAAIRRSHLEHRLAVVADTTAGLRAGLHSPVTGHAAAPPRLVFVFPGQGSQWPGMGRALLADEPVFRAAFDACARALAPHFAGSPHAALTDPDAEQQRSDRVQPVLWAFGVALAALWRSWGVHPDAVVGHSMGEVAAACVAGSLSLEDGARIIAVRSRLARDGGRGEMALVELTLADAEQAVADLAPRVVVGVHNGPRACVLSGEPAALSLALDRLTARGVWHRRVRVDYASHSPMMRPLVGPLTAALAGVTPRRGDVPMLSTLTADWHPALDPAYWAANLHERVRFADAVTRLLATTPDSPTAAWTDQPRIFLEVSPHPVLVPAIRDALPHGHQTLASLRRDEDPRACLLTTLGALHVTGAPVDLARLFPDGGRTVDLPPIAWQRTPHWFTAAAPARAAAGGHPRLGHAFTAPSSPDAHLFAATLSLADPPYLADHRVGAAAVVPAATWIDLVLTAARALGSPVDTILDAAFESALVLPDTGDVAVQIALTRTASADLEFTCHARAAASWTRHATGLLRTTTAAPPPIHQGLPAPTHTAATFYAELATRGLDYGPLCRGVESLAHHGDRVIATLTHPATDVPGAVLHPVLLDAALHATAALADPDDRRPLVPVGLRRLHVHAAGPLATAVARVRARTRDHLECDIHILGPDGALLVDIEALALHHLRGARIHHPDLWSPTWRPLDPPPIDPAPRRWLLVPDRTLAPQLQARLEALGDHVTLWPAAGPVDGVLDLSILDACIPADMAGDDVLRLTLDAVDHALTRARALLAAPSRLFLLTRDAWRTDPADPPANPVQAALWGFGRTLAAEHPELRCTCIDLDSNPATLETLARELHAASDEDLLALRGARRLGARLTPGALATDLPPAPTSPGATLITGGLGGLGLGLARWLVDRGAVHLVLLGRRGLTTDDQARTIAALRSAGARVDVHAVDVADADALARVLEDLDAPLTSVFHAAGTLDDRFITNLGRAALETTMAPKIAGAWNLHRLTRDRPDLQNFVVYSSVASLIGSPGQANYAAANAFLDALVEHRRALGLPALGVHWGAVADVGLAARDPQRGARLAERGLPSLPLERAHAHLAHLLADPTVARLAVAPFDPATWRTFYPSTSPLLGELLPTASTPLAETPPADIDDLLRAEVARVLRVDPARLHRHTDLLTLGLDSLTGLELRNRLELRLGLPLRAAIAWTHPRLGDLAAHLTDLVAAREPAPTPPPPPTTTDDLTGLTEAQLLKILADELERAS